MRANSPIALSLWTWLCCIVVHAAVPPSFNGQSINNPAVSLQLDATPRKVKVAEPVRLQLQVFAPRGALVTLPQAEQTIGPFQIVDRSSVNDIPVEGDPGRRMWTLWLTLESLEAGTFTIEPLQVGIEWPNDLSPAGSSRTLPTEALQIEVVSMLTPDDQPADFRDIKASVPRDASPHQSSYLKWIGMATFLLLSIGLFMLHRWRGGVELSPEQWVQREINRIESLAGSNHRAPSETYAELSATLRRFLEWETHIPAITLSTPEIREALADRKFASSSIDAVFEFLSNADEARFSGMMKPAAPLNAMVWSELREIVRQIHEHSAVIEQGA